MKNQFLSSVTLSSFIFIAGCAALNSPLYTQPRTGKTADLYFMTMIPGNFSLYTFKDPINCRNRYYIAENALIKDTENQFVHVKIPANQEFTFNLQFSKPLNFLIARTCNITGSFTPQPNKPYVLGFSTREQIDRTDNNCYLHLITGQNGKLTVLELKKKEPADKVATDDSGPFCKPAGK